MQHEPLVSPSKTLLHLQKGTNGNAYKKNTKTKSYCGPTQKSTLSTMFLKITGRISYWKFSWPQNQGT